MQVIPIRISESKNGRILLNNTWKIKKEDIPLLFSIENNFIKMSLKVKGALKMFYFFLEDFWEEMKKYKAYFPISFVNRVEKFLKNKN